MKNIVLRIIAVLVLTSACNSLFIPGYVIQDVESNRARVEQILKKTDEFLGKHRFKSLLEDTKHQLVYSASRFYLGTYEAIVERTGNTGKKKYRCIELFLSADGKAEIFKDLTAGSLNGCLDKSDFPKPGCPKKLKKGQNLNNLQ